MSALPLLLAVGLGSAALATACPGEGLWPIGRFDVGVVQPDRGSVWDQSVIVDTGPTPVDAGTKDKGIALDRTVTADKGGTKKPGGPCPCAAPLVCSKAICRARCTKAPCNGGSGCRAGQACVPTVKPGILVCVPGVAVGSKCDPATPCRTGGLCLGGQGAASGTCYASCTTSACRKGTCTSIPGSACKYCYQ